MENQIEIKQTEMLQALNRAEIDVQIATAKQYPRNIQVALTNIQTIASTNEQTASECFYALRKGGEYIEGVSVRLAEIIAGCWGNIRVQTRIIGNDGKTITAQGICHDLETNYAVSVEVKRRITDKYGRTYSEDMQVVTGNAASAIAYRNAILKVVPKAITDTIIDKIKEVAIGRAKDLETTRKNMIEYFGKLGVSKQQVMTYLHVSRIEEINTEMVFELRGLANALKEGSTTLEDTFQLISESETIATEAKRKAEASKKKAEQAIASAESKPSTPTVDEKKVETNQKQK